MTDYEIKQSYNQSGDKEVKKKMNPLYNEPLTDEEQRFAEEKYYLVPFFIRKFERYYSACNLDYDVMWDCVIGAYMRTVKRYFADPTLRQYSFSILLRYAIGSQIIAHIQKEARRWNIRRVQLIAHDKHGDEIKNMNVLEDLADTNDPYEEIYSRDYFDRITNILTDKEKAIFTYLIDGYTHQDIANKTNIPRSTVQNRASKLREKNKE